CFQQLDLIVGEWARPGARYRDGAHGSALSQDGYKEATSPADCAGERSNLELRIELNVQYVDDCALEDRSHGAFHDRIEHRLCVSRRVCDGPHVAGRSLLLERNPQLAVARPQLSEQSHVLDRDDGLVGEALQQRDLLVRELPYLPAAKEEAPARHAFAET